MLVLLVCWQSIIIPGSAQHEEDSVRQLSEVVVQAFSYNRPSQEIPASIGVIRLEDFQRFNELSLVPTMNAVPGVRLEERSPGSYRVSIRGSTLRSPFGVRNVKVYWNNIPLTDPGGNTYLNQLDPSMIGSMEIVKGPGSSLYGAGTGGVLLINSPSLDYGHRIKAGTQFGSFGSSWFTLGYQEAGDKSTHEVQAFHQQSDGYREQTQMMRSGLNSVFHFEVDDNQVLETFIFYSHVNYETPGGLTLAEFNSSPKQARPAAGPIPGAVEQKASVDLHSFYTGVAHEYFFSSGLHNRTSVYGNLVKFENAAIRNYEHRNEQNLGARSVTTFRKKSGSAEVNLLGGGEFQWGFSPIKTYENLSGTEGVLLTDDEAKILLYSLFGQAELSWQKFSATGGLSFNGLRYDFHRLSDVNSDEERVSYVPEIMPRLALLFKPATSVSVYASASRGFSPPTLAEINASNGVFNKDLEPEVGWNFEVGTHLSFLQNRLSADLSLYSFNLDETIVIRREPDGAEYFVNAGGTRQQGVELNISGKIVSNDALYLMRVSGWLNYAFNHYRFVDYAKGDEDFSGNALTGSPAHVFSSGLDMEIKSGFYFRPNVLYTLSLPLNDANTVYADSFVLLGVRAGYKRKRFEMYAGSDNLLNETYSMGHDLNAAGGRYYNTAPARNLYAGLRFNVELKKQ